MAANRENPLPAAPCLRRGRGQIKSSRLRPLLHAAALVLDRAPADVVAVELAGPGDAGHFGVSALLRVGNAVAQRAHAQHAAAGGDGAVAVQRSEEHTSELQSLMRISYAVFCLKKKT